jgi:hypothetical protein
MYRRPGAPSGRALDYPQVGETPKKLGTIGAKRLIELTKGGSLKMKKIASLVLAAAALSSFAGCSTDTATEMTAEETAALCANPEGTNAAIAALATAMSQELHRWQIKSDFYVYRGFNNQAMLGLTQAGLNACGGSCPVTSVILGYQDSRMDQKIVFNGVKLSSWSFASRLVTGYENQGVCQSNGTCPFVPHVFSYDSATTTPGACDTLFTFGVAKPASAGGGNLTAAQVSQLSNALKWTTGNGPNPYIAFQSTANTVTIDPTGQVNPPGQATGAEICQKVSFTNINGTPCTCAVNNIYANGQLKNDDPLTPRTYFCRQM